MTKKISRYSWGRSGIRAYVNFRPDAAQVLLDQTPVSGVKWVDDQHMEFSLPLTSLVKRYTLWVVNPDGIRAASSLLLASGSWLYLPAVSH